MHSDALENIIDVSAAERLIAAHDGDVALLLIYIRSRGCTDPERAAGELCRTRSEIDAAMEKLRRMGLMPAEEAASAPAVPAQPSAAEPAQKLPPEDRLPEYRAEDIIIRSKEDPAFSAVVVEAQRVMGHALGSADLRKLFGIYDYLALPPELIMVLLNYCLSLTRSTNGEGRRPSMRQIEKEAYKWSNREITSLEQAEEYITKSRLRREDTALTGEVLGIRGRDLSPTERRFIGEWLDMGFKQETIALAYDRTVTNTGALKWNYMDKILHSWHEKGIHELWEIEQKDTRRSSGGAPKTEQPIDIDALRLAMDNM